MRTTIGERCLRRHLTLQKHPCRVRDQDLPAVPNGHKACHAIDSWSKIIAAALIGGACVQPHTHAYPTDRRVIFFGKRALCIKRSGHRIGWTRERDAEGVANCLEDVTMMAFEDAAQQRIVALNRGTHVIAMRLPAFGRTLDVGEKKRDRAGRHDNIGNASIGTGRRRTHGTRFLRVLARSSKPLWRVTFRCAGHRSAGCH